MVAVFILLKMLAISSEYNFSQPKQNINGSKRNPMGQPASESSLIARILFNTSGALTSKIFAIFWGDRLNATMQFLIGFLERSPAILTLFVLTLTRLKDFFKEI